ncbi:MAG: tRNA (adenosine(37)-N6)-threonylcarbamoyltransferase complex ATPase subunit type 1 TsaE [Acidimicrobiales bacterium]
MIDVVGWSVTARVRTPDDLRALAASLAPLARPGDVILLVGGLGAGKTTFAQGFAQGLGITGPVTSPTFTLVRQYPCAGKVRQLLHADVYRLETLAQIADLGLAELVEDGGVALVEWGDAAAPVLGDGALSVRLTVDAPTGDAATDSSPTGDAATGSSPTGSPPGGNPPGESEARLVTVTGGTVTWTDRREAVEAAIARVVGEGDAGHGPVGTGTRSGPGWAGGVPR